MADCNAKGYNELIPRWLALGAAVVALALRLHRLDFQTLWWDEGISLYLAAQGLDALVFHKNFALDLHPPLYHLLLGIWTGIVGQDAFTARALSVFLGVANVPLLYALVRRLAGPVASVAAAWVLAVSPVHIYYSQESRMYTLMPLLATLSLLAFVRLLDAPGGAMRRKAALAYVAATAVGLWAYYYVGLLVIAQNAFFALRWLVRRQGLRTWVASQFGVLLLFGGWLLVLGNMFLTTDFWAVQEKTFGAGELLPFLQAFGTAYAVGFSLVDPWSGRFAIAFLGLGLVGVGAGGRRAWGRRWLLLLWLLVPVLLTYVIATQRAFVFPRFVLFSALAVYALAGVGVAWLWRLARPLGALALAVLLAASAVGLPLHYATPRTAYASSDYVPLLREVGSLARPSDLLVTDQAWGAGYARAYLPEPLPALLWAPTAWAKEPLLAERELGRLLAERGRVWVFSWLEGGKWQGSPLEDALARSATTLFVDQYGEFRVRLFARTGEAPVVAQVAGRADLFGDGVSLVGYARVGAARPGGSLAVTLAWRARARPAKAYTIFVQALGPDGKVYGQQDSQPVRGTVPTSVWQSGETITDRYEIRLAPGAAAGEYRLIAGMYDPATMARLPVGGADHVVLETFTVTVP
ncbi:MAG: glycosyltransferase family 39 protein [Chloroflexota bacterium]